MVWNSQHHFYKHLVGFSLVDDISDEQGVLKLDFISNDTFILASGLPDETVHHCRQMAKFATKLLKEIQQFAKTGLQIKIGIHSGEVAASIMFGPQMYQFHLDTLVMSEKRRIVTNLPPLLCLQKLNHRRYAP